MSETAIQKVEQQSLDTLGNVVWTRAMLDLCKVQVCPKGITDDEFTLFIEQCKASGLNPFIKEAFCVPRRTNVGSKEQAKWVTKHEFQASADGMRARAARFGDFVSSTSAAVYANDNCTVDVDAGEVRHTFNPCKPRGNLMGAWGKVVKKGASKPTVQWLPAGSRSGNSQFWSADAGGMLAKCAEVAALRRAYPTHLGNVHTREELPDEHQEPSRAEQVLAAASGAQQVQSPLAPALPPPPVTVGFGEWKARPVESLSRGEVQAALEFGRQQLEDPKYAKAKWRKGVEDTLGLLKKRLAALPPEADVTDAEWAPSEPTTGEQSAAEQEEIARREAELAAQEGRS